MSTELLPSAHHVIHVTIFYVSVAAAAAAAVVVFALLVSHPLIAPLLATGFLGGRYQRQIVDGLRAFARYICVG